MRFKVTKKDLVTFGIFCIVLLYLSAIAVLNVINLINEGAFYGFNPIEAFTGKYIFGTLMIFFSVIAAVFFSVSSSIFEHKDGFGFGLEIGDKDNKGYSRWLKEKEMKKAFKVYKVGVKDEDAPVGGVVFINDGKNMWVDDSEFHTLVMGVTGSGKTSAVVDPLVYSLVKHRESMIFTDPKGEIYKDHANLMRARGYNIVVLNFRDPQMGNSWNPLTLPYKLYQEGNIDKAIELVDDVASNIVKDKGGQNDPFWQNSSADYFAGCTLGLLQDAKEEEVNLNSIGYMTTVGEEKFGAGSTYIKEYFTMKGEQSSAYTFASNTINSPTETKGGILSTFRQKIRIFSSRENLSEMLSYSDFNMRDIGKVPTAVFMIIHDEKTTYHALATIFIKQCYETLISVAQECGGKLPVRTNFILDEFANMPALKDVTTMVTAARSRLIRFTFIIQNFAQLNDVYGKDDAETIRSNCGNLIYILTTELAALEEISKLCGEVKNKDDEKGESHPLVTVSDLQKMKINEVIIIRNRMHPFKTQLVQAYKVDWGSSKYEKAELVKREKREIQLFDVKEFVKVRKQSKLKDGDKGDNPMGGFAGLAAGGISGMGGSPMGGGAPKIPTFEEFMAARNGGKKEEPKKPALPTFDVDDLVKRIDAKIAELEAQEKAEEEAKKNGGVVNKPTEEKTIVQPQPVEEKTNIQTAPVSQESKPVIKPEEVKSEPVSTVTSTIDIKEVPTPSKPGGIIDPTHMPFVDNVSTATEVHVPPVTAPVNEIKAEPVSGIANPFAENKEAVSPKFVDKDAIDSIPDSVVNTPISVPSVPTQEQKPASDGIHTFNDLMNQTPKTEEVVKMPDAKPSIMISNPIDNGNDVPELPSAPVIAPPKPVPGPSVSISQQNAIPTGQPVSTITSVPEISVNTQNTQVVNTAAPSAPVNPQPTVVSGVSDDAFFDDFFEED